ncbi:alpha-1,2 mannosyltransferase [Ascosphaera apis ARSEF 7405]|uniref:Alpha-1,2 mannosyltransferase n=1 Tax=Ascosphaera apis ARSEF 7405 TaxID=392613 RepID=A0A167XQ28_9EURO|nr:alpha-1,2 mannosyltransferase [Ascosphaera apis ARSEF 7405]
MPVQGRYVRYILVAILTLVVIHFITSSTLPVPSAADLASSLRSGSPVNSAENIPPVPAQNQQDSAPNSNPANQAAPAPADQEKPAEQPAEQPKPEEPKTDAKPPAEKPTDQDAAEGQSPAVASPPVLKAKLENATFVTLARNQDVWEIAKSIRQVEDRFNRNYGYDWVFLNDGDFNDEFKKVTTALVSGKTHYGKIPKEEWGIPEHISEEKAAETREKMKDIIYGSSVSYRHMCRYESGFFFRHPLMMNYDYYWRVEPSVEYFCDIHFDPFKFMRENGKKYSFVIALHEYKETVKTLWDSVKKFFDQNPQYLAEDNNAAFVSDDGGKTYNMCHFWSNFEIGDLNFLRSEAYLKYFDFLDHEGGFFYERWGDAPVHSIAAALMLKKSEIQFFEDIAYRHVPFVHCPTDEKKWTELKCHCNPKDNFDWHSFSCVTQYFDVNGLKKPDDWEKQRDGE